ncbi:MAG: DPP IV N-terminal domain-containing protein [Planctomycetota bacterium]
MKLKSSWIFLAFLIGLFAMNEFQGEQAIGKTVSKASLAATPPRQETSTKPSEPLTVAEKSDFKSTSLSAEVVQFVDACDKKANHVRKFVWGSTVEGRDMIGAIVATKPYQLGQQDDRNVMLLLGNIHSGECAGKEALLMMLRELADNPQHPWLERNVILFAPNYNADGNDRVGKNNRPGQIGPINGMGRRENAQQLDLNRDFSKIESPEARALVKLIDTANPHLFVDCHTTDGSRHQYKLTYDIPHNPATAKPIRDFLREKMMPKVTSQLEADGTLTFYYGNFGGENSTWTTYGYEPRYSTEYVGLRGRLAILSEAYSYLDYKGRIFATKDFCSALLDYATENHETIHQLLDAVDRDLIETAQTSPQRIDVSLSAKAVAFPLKCTIKAYKQGEPFDFECEFIGKYESTKSVPLPYAYVIPVEHARVVDRLLMHGATVHQLDDDLETSLQIDTVKNLNRQPRAFQRHKMVRVETDRQVKDATIKKGSYVVLTAQPLGRWIAYMLEPESADGYAFWNFFDDVLEKNAEFPVRRIPRKRELKISPVTEVTKVGKITLDLIDGTFGLLKGAPRSPRWLGKTNILRTNIYSREMLLDAETASFVNRPARPYQTANVEAALIDAGVEKELAKSIANSNPTLPTNNQVVLFSNKGYAWLYWPGESANTKASVEMIGSPEAKAEVFSFSDDESKLAFISNNELNFYDLKSKQTITIKKDHDKSLVGKFDWVYQEELYGRGNFKGYWWQTGGQHVAFLKLDETPLVPFTVMDHLPVHGKSELTNYPKAGDPNPTVEVGVFDTGSSSDITWIDLSKYKGEEILVSGVTWSSDGKQLMLQVQNREQTWLDLVATDAMGQNARVLFRDQTPAWIESPGDPVLLNNGDFLWRSPRSGYSHLYRYSKDGTLIGALTQGDWEIRSLVGVDSEKKYCYVTATKDSPIEVHGYRIDLQSGEMIRITELGKNHSLRFNDAYSYFIDSASDVSSPTTYSLRNNEGKLIRQFNASSNDRLNYLDVSKPEFLTVPSGNDQPLDAMIIKPPNFDPDKKYPVLVHIYAGPQAPRVKNSFGGSSYLWHQMLAQQGYIVWMCDNQSASYRSVKNAWPIHRNMATNELRDIETGVDWLCDQPWVDQDRIGIWGWSYGGYMTAFCLTHSDKFKIGISGAPVTDWKNYDSIYTERYMGTPQENQQGYESSSVLYNSAKNLSGKLLLIHGTIDDNVHLNNTLQFVKELQYAGKQFELMLYPSNRHSVRDPLQSRHLRKLMTDFIVENL